MMGEGPSGSGADPRERVDRFRQNVRQPLLIAGLSGILLALLIAAALIGPGFEGDAWDLAGLALGVVFLGGLIGAALWAARRRPVVLVVGPDGIALPIAWRGPIAWRDIHRVRREVHQRLGLGQAHWLAIDPAPGVLPDYRWSGPRRLELWWLRKGGIRVPLSGLAGDPDVVIASIERYRAVSRGAP